MATNAKVNEGQAMIVALSLDTVPGDILFEIFQKLPQSSFGPLAHTCRALRIFIEENGIALCNSRIKMLYSATLNRLTIEAVCIIFPSLMSNLICDSRIDGYILDPNWENIEKGTTC